jgi:hypothetical protein
MGHTDYRTDAGFCIRFVGTSKYLSEAGYFFLYSEIPPENQ